MAKVARYQELSRIARHLSESRAATLAVPLANTIRSWGALIHRQAGAATDTMDDFNVPGGIVINKFCLPNLPSNNACTWSQMADRCQFHVNGVDGSMIGQHARRNCASDMPRACCCAGDNCARERSPMNCSASRSTAPVLGRKR